MAVTEQGAPRTAHDPPRAIFVRFLKFGALAWGGPAAQIAMIKHECVDQEGWVDEETFKKTLTVYQVLPGPEAHELCVYFGRIRGGKLGGFLAGLGFMLPGFLLMLGLSILYVEADLARHLDELFYGLKAAVGALLARALVRLSRLLYHGRSARSPRGGSLRPDRLRICELCLGPPRGRHRLRTVDKRAPVDPADSRLSLAPVALLAVATGALTLSLTAEIFWEGLKAGLVTFGGAFTVIPYLHDATVEGQHWLTDTQFVDGLAMSGVLPAPFIIFSTFVGYLTGGLGGSLAMTVGIFLPAFVFPIFLHRWLVAVAKNPRIRPFLLGVAAAVIGLIAAVTVDILDESIVDVPTAILAVAAFGALNRWHGKLTVVAVVLGCGAAGVILQATGAA